MNILKLWLLGVVVNERGTIMITHKSLLCVAVAGCIGSFSPVLHAMEKGENGDIFDYSLYESPLHQAVMTNSESYFKKVIAEMKERGESLEQPIHRRNDCTALHWAAEKNQSAMIAPLFEAGALAEARDSLGRTPLHLAASNNCIAAICILMSHGADIKARTCYADSPLVLAVRSGRTAALSLLYSQGRQIDEKIPGYWGRENRLRDLYEARAEAETTEISSAYLTYLGERPPLELLNEFIHKELEEFTVFFLTQTKNNASFFITCLSILLKNLSFFL